MIFKSWLSYFFFRACSVQISDAYMYLLCSFKNVAEINLNKSDLMLFGLFIPHTVIEQPIFGKHCASTGNARIY